MQPLFRSGLFFLIILAFSPVVNAQCPEGTRNNYKGECVPIASLKQDIQILEKNAQRWSEPATDSGVIEGVSSEDSAESVVIVEEVGKADEIGSLVVAVEEPMPDPATTTDLANAILTIQQLREEIRDLLNRVELQRYEVEKLRGRQRDLYNDLDQRLRKQERLALKVPMPEMPSVDSIVIPPEVALPAEPTPIVVGVEQPLSSANLNIDSAKEVTVTSEAQDEETSGVAVSAESDVAAPAPTPMVAGADISTPTVDSGAAVIDQTPTQADAPESEASEGFVVVEQMSDETVNQVTTGAVEPIEPEGNENAVNIGISIALDTEENQPDAEGNLNSGDEIDSVGPIDASLEEQNAGVVVTLTNPTIVTLGEQDAYDQAFNMLKQSRYEEAAEEFASFLRQYRSSQLTDDAWYWMAEAHYVTRDYERALIGFNTVVSYFINSPRIPASRLKIGYIQYETADYEGSRETLTQLLQDFPAHRVAVSAEARLKKMNRERQ